MSILGKGFRYIVEVEKDGVVTDRTVEQNLIPQEGVDFIAALLRGSGPSPIANWYVGVFENNYVPDSSITAAGIPTTVGESLAYDETSRPAFVHSYDGVGFIGNAPNPAEFTFNADKMIYGAFIVSSSTKGSNTGILMSIVRFSTAKDLEAGSVLRVMGGITLLPTV